MNISFFAPGNPKGQPRPRAFSRGGFTRVYDPGTAEGWKSEIAVAAKPFLPPAPIEGPVRLSTMFTLPRPKSHFTKKGLKLTAPIYCLSKPDFDNLAKAVADCLTALRFWKDDAQVCLSQQTKMYGAIPGCQIEITTL